MFWYCFREREKILDLFEMSSGQRMHTRYIQVGGVIEDIPRGFEEKLRGVPRGHAQPGRPVRRPAQPQRDRPAPPARHVPARRGDAARARRHRPAAARRPATRGTCARRCRTRATRTSTSRSRSAPQGDNYDRYAVPPGRDEGVGEDHRAGARRAARGAATSPTTARSRCRRATSWRPRWRRSSTTSSS